MKANPIYIFFLLFISYSCDTNKVENLEIIELSEHNIESDTNYIFYTVNPNEFNVGMYWENSTDEPFSNFNNLKNELAVKNKELIFAMNGGMYLKDQSPQGLFIENGIQKKKLDKTKTAYGNFYMQPNGVFYIDTNNKPKICKSTDFINNDSIKFATQSGPMLIIDGVMHPKFIDGSTNLHIRNGVGILPNGDLLFAMSKKEVNFYDFATYFKTEGCKNALYLDGFVSRTYLPSKKWEQIDGNFGVIIGVTKDINHNN